MSAPSLNERNARFIFLALVAVVTALRFGLAAGLELIPDEAYYWSWSHSLEWCYYDQPGMIGWISWLATRVTDIWTPFAARLPMVLLSTLALLVMYATGREFSRDHRIALATVVVLCAGPMMLLGGFLVMHDVPLLFFWICSCWLFARFIRKPAPWHLYAMAVTLNGALYSKFTGIFFGLGIVLFFALSPHSRVWLRSVHFWLAAALAAVMFLPVLLWNIRYDWAAYQAVAKLGSKEPTGLGEGIGMFFEYQLAQTMLMSPVLYAVMLVVLYDACRRWYREYQASGSPSDRELFCIVMSVPAMAFFSLMNLRTAVQANWVAFAYPTVMLLIADRFFREGERWWKRPDIVAWGLAIGYGISLFGALHVSVYLVPATLENTVKKDRLLKEFFGWHYIAEKVAEYQKPGEKLMAMRYQVCSELEFYHPRRERVYCMNAFKRGNQYDIWQNFADLHGQDILIVAEKVIPDELIAAFDYVEPKHRIPLFFRGVDHRGYLLYRGYNFDIHRAADLNTCINPLW